MSKTLEEIITSPSLVRENWLPTELAVREVLAFERRFGPRHLKLACHAALPLILSPELVNLIHLNFLEGEGIPWVAEVDLLLSPLCRPVDEGLYEVEPAIREVLLVELENQFGWERPFELANFLQFYLANKTGLKLRPEIIQTQRWIAQAYIDPDKLVEALNNWLESSLSQEDNRLGLSEQIQLITSLELLAEPLELTNQLTEYQKIANNSRVLAQMLYGDEQALRRKIWQEQVDGEIVDIQSMQISSTILIQLMSRNETLTESEDIYRYQKALEVYTFEEFPEQWATTQVQLAVAYLDFISVNRAEHLEQAIFAFEAALQVRTREDFPAHWAEIQNYLGLTYKERIWGEKAENLERAIACCLEAFQVFTLEAFPENWAEVQNTLGSIYTKRIRGDRAENLEYAIACCLEALKVFSFDAFPENWAEVQNTLGSIYTKRIRGDRAENLEQAIACCQQALQVFTPEAFPYDWAATQNNLGNAYRDRIRGDKAENLERAIACFQESLKVRTFDALPVQWAETQVQLALAFQERIRGDRAENLEYAIACCREALVFTFDAFPYDWAATQNNLGNAYRDRIRGDKAENLKRAIKCYHNALRILTKQADPLNCLQTARNLANLHYREKQWQPATEAYHLAIEVIENVLLEALNPQSRQEILSNAIDLSYRIVQAYINLNQPDRALEYIERSKARNFVELMTQKNVKPPGVSQEIIDQLDELRQRWVNEQIRLQSRSINQNISSNDKLMPYISDDSHLREYRQALEDFIDQKITPIDPTFRLTQKIKPINFREIQSLLNVETALIEWYITNEKILAFIITSQELNPIVFQSSAEDYESLINLANDYLNNYSQDKRQWRDHLPSYLQRLSDLLHLNQILTYIPSVCSQLIFVPHRILHLFPLHALPVNSDRTCLIDLFSRGIRYAPSCLLLQVCQNYNRPNFSNLLAIQNPTNDMIFTDLEVEILKQYFETATILAHESATKSAFYSSENLNYVHCLHLSAHSYFNFTNPLESAIILADKEYLTLAEIFELNLNQCRLVTLSACETALTDFNSLSDEYIGFAGAFLYAGIPTVVGSLWTLNDLQTAILMIKFYENIRNITRLGIGDVALALNQAQNWLRNLTVEEFEEFLESLEPQLEQVSSSLKKSQRLVFTEVLERIPQGGPHPFANPYYWAGFIAVGV